MALERDHGRRRVRVEHGADAAQVAEPLLADGRRQQHGRGRRLAGRGEVAAELDQGRDGDAVVADAGPVQPAAIAPGSSGVPAGNTVSMCAATTIAGPAGPTRASTLPAASVTGSRPASRSSVGDRGRARLLREGRRGDGAQGEGVADEVFEHGGGGAGPLRLATRRTLAGVRPCG